LETKQGAGLQITPDTLRPVKALDGGAEKNRTIGTAEIIGPKYRPEKMSDDQGGEKPDEKAVSTRGEAPE